MDRLDQFSQFYFMCRLFTPNFIKLMLIIQVERAILKGPTVSNFKKNF